MERNQKGKSLISFPSDYSVIDIETTGLSTDYDYIIELSAVKYSKGIEKEYFSSLVRPYDDDGIPVELNSFVEELTGITDSILSNAPSIKEILPDFLNFLGNDILIGHNINFDINFIYDNAQKHLNTALSNDFVDTMRISRLLYPDVSHHRLSDLSSRYNIDYSMSHRALSDCYITHDCFCALENDISDQFGSLDNFVLHLNSKRSQKHKLNPSDIVSSSNCFDVSHPLYQKICVFTGTLEKMTRREAMQIVADHGGINANSVTKKTNYLILGNNDYCSTIKGGKSSKQKKAEELILSGSDLAIIPENVFYDMIAECPD